MRNTFTEMAEEWMRRNRMVLDEGSPAGMKVQHLENESVRHFELWVKENCVHREGRDDWGSISQLWVHFCEWIVRCGESPCSRQRFEQLLLDAGFDTFGGMIAGLVLREDMEAVLNWRSIL